MNKEIGFLKKNILEMHKKHITENQEHIIKFEEMVKSLGEMLNKSYPEKQAVNELLTFLGEIQQLTDKTLSKNNKNNIE